MSDQTQKMNLDNVDAVVLIDMSPSMDGMVSGMKMTRLDAGRESITALAEELAEHDDDGITVVPFSGQHRVEDGVTPDKVAQVFDNPGIRRDGTRLAGPLSAAIDLFIAKEREVVQKPRQVTKRVQIGTRTKPQSWFDKLMGRSVEQEPVYEDRTETVTENVQTGNYKRQKPPKGKQVFIAVYTDGEAQDGEEAIRVIADATKRIISRQDLGILFIQVGDDPDAAAFLERLNNGLEGGVADFDIVACVKLEQLEKLSIEDTIRLAFTD